MCNIEKHPLPILSYVNQLRDTTVDEIAHGMRVCRQTQTAGKIIGSGRG